MQKTNHLITAGTVMLLMLGSLFYTSCNKADEKIDIPQKTASEKPSPAGIVPKSGGNLGYLDENNEFRLIADAWLRDYYRQILQLGDLELGSPVIIDGVDAETGNPVYLLQISSTDGTLRITEGLDRYGETYYTLQGVTCTCKSKACAYTYGCTAKIVAGDCKCTECTGDCKKETTTTSKLFIQDFFNVYYALGN